ncbi:uncharacterized protein [Apostichopus japonicus]|uniref:uncharacterized protein isoform X13 n=1 Tax=Stichopus japonicus TaxID=307972 RepID=UPI003AB48320
MTRQVISIFMRYATRQTAHLAPNLILIMMFKQGRSAFLWNTCGCFAVKIFQDSPATIFTTSQPFPLPATLCTNLLPHRSTILLNGPSFPVTNHQKYPPTSLLPLQKLNTCFPTLNNSNHQQPAIPTNQSLSDVL